MSYPPACPHCGAAKQIFFYACGTRTDRSNKRSIDCQRNELRHERETRQKAEASVKNLKGLLRLVLPHIPANAIDVEKARTHKIDECYLNTMVREALEQGGAL